MIELPPIGPSTPNPARASADPGAWRIGQVFKAVVVSGTPAGHSGGEAVLRIGKGELPIRAQLALTTGTQLSVQVRQVGPETLLRVLDQPPGGTAQPDPLAALMRDALPRQGGLPTFFATAGLLAQAKASANLPAPVAQHLSRLMEGIAEGDEVARPDGLRRALRESGLFLEAELAQAARADGAANVQRDLKAALLRLLAQLARTMAQPATPQAAARTPSQPLTAGSAPPPRAHGQPIPQGRAAAAEGLLASRELALATLRQMAEAAIARIQLHQLATVESSQQSEQRWMGEIPVRQGEAVDILPIRIDKESMHSKSGSDAESRWSAVLALDLPNLGPMQVRVSVHGQQVSTVFKHPR